MHNSETEVTCCYQNVRGLRTKTHDFYTSVTSGAYNIVAVTETWLQSDILSSEIFPDTYVCYRSDRQLDLVDVSRGGGVLLAVDEAVQTEVLDLSLVQNEVPEIDILGCKLNFKHFLIYVLVVYIPPSLCVTQIEYFFELLSSADILYNRNVLIMGDFNIPHFNEHTISSSKQRHLNTFFSTLNLRQFNDVPNANNRRLDLIFGNLDCVVSRNRVPLVTEDAHHPSLLVKFKAQLPRIDNFPINKENLYNFNFRKANFPLLYNLILNADWSPVTNQADVTKSCESLYNILNSIFSASIPLKQKRRRSFPPWFNKEIINNIFKKERAYRNFRVFKSDFYLRKFESLRSLIKVQCQHAYRMYILNAERNIADDPTHFWSFIQSKRTNSRIPTSMRDPNGVPHSDPISIATAFSDYFQSVYSVSSNLENPIPFDCLSTIVDVAIITLDDVVKASKTLKNKLTAGPDGIPSFLVKDCSVPLATPLVHIFNQMLKSGVYPNLWKGAKAYPIFKKGDPNVITNYRPISILCNFSKIFEIILSELVSSELNNRFSTYQQGFLSGRSCVTNLSLFSQFVCETLDTIGQVDVLYTDFQKAFDQIDHFILLEKMECQFGFSNRLINLIRSYMTGRKLYVEIEGFKSPPITPTSGVPQGSNLGPLLFNIFMNDLLCKISCNKLAYADDLKIYNRINDYNDCVALQSNIDIINEWCLNNRLRLNVSKCNVVSYYRIKNPILFDYEIQGTILSRLKTIKDLGVIFDERFSFIPHIETMIADASKVLGFIIRISRQFSSTSIVKLLYQSFVRSKLDYCSLIWSPIYECHSYSIESVQRRFLKYLVFMEDGIYPARGADHNLLLARYNEQPLKKRRDIQSVSFLFKLLHGIIDCPLLLEKIDFHVPHVRSRHQNAFRLKVARTNILYQCPIYNMCQNFNYLSNICDIHSDSLNIIKTRLINISQ